MADQEKPVDEKAKKQLEEYRERMRRRAAGEGPSEGNRTGNAATEQTRFAPSAPDQSQTTTLDDDGNDSDVEITGGGESGPKKSLLEELLEFQDKSGLSEEELIARLGSANIVDLTADDQTEETIPGSFPGSPTETEATPPARPASSNSNYASNIVDGLRTAMGYFLGSGSSTTPTTSATPTRPSRPAPAPLPRSDSEYSLVSPSETTGYIPDPHSQYQEYYGIPPPPQTQQPQGFPQFQPFFGPVPGLGGRPAPPFPFGFNDPYRLPRPNSAPFPFADPFGGTDGFDRPFPFGYHGQQPAYRQRPPPNPFDLLGMLFPPPGSGGGYGGGQSDDPVAQRIAQGIPTSYEDLVGFAERMGGSGPRGAAGDAIEDLPRFKWKTPKGKEKDSGSAGSSSSADDHQLSCPVCLAHFEEGEEVMVLPKCLHKYHVECGESALGVDRRCPVCRVEI
jgi:hypothetical protein